MTEEKPRLRWNYRNNKWQTHSEKHGFMRYFLRSCINCGDLFVGGGCRKVCIECGLQVIERRDRVYQKAHSAVTKAVRKGELPRLNGSVRCVDCGKTAEAYDHRDYSKPLEVVPVCRRCNHKRGHAKGIEEHSLRALAKKRGASA